MSTIIQSVVILTRLPYVTFFTFLVSHCLLILVLSSNGRFV